MRIDRRIGMTMVVGAALGLPVAAASASESPRRLVEDTVARGGAVVMQLVASPDPRLLGPGTDVVFRDGALSGVVEGGRYDVRLSGERAEGRGPRGPISLSLDQRADGSLVVEGTWNGEPVDLTFADRGVRGKVVHHVSGLAREVESCQVDLAESKGVRLTGLATCLGNQLPLRYTVDPGPEARLSRPEMALLMLSYLSAAPSPPPA